MADLAASFSGRPSFWNLLVENSPGRLAFALRLTLICALTAIIAEIYQTPDIALTVYCAFFLNKPDRLSSTILTIAITLVLTIIIGSLLVAATPLLSTVLARIAAMTCVSFVLLFLVSASKLKPLGSTMALIIAYALDLLGSVPAGEVATRALLYAWLFVGIPAGVSLVVNLLFAPAPRRMLQHELAHRLRVAAGSLQNDSPKSIKELVRLVDEGDGEIQERLHLALIEKTTSKQTMAALQAAADAVVSILSSLRLILSEADALSHNVRAQIQKRMLDMARIFQRGGYPARVESVDLEALEEQGCSEIARTALLSLNNALQIFGEGRPDLPHTEAPKTGFFLPDAFSNPEHFHYAFKTTIAAMFCYLFYSVLSWPGIHTSLITCFIVSLGTVAESIEKLTLRIIGCLVGAGLGLLVLLKVIPNTTDIGQLVFVVSCGVFFAAWIAVGSPRISYAGFQLAFAYLLCVIQGTAPSFNLVVARDRVLGILLGNTVAYFVTTRLWPQSISFRIESLIEKIRQQFEAIKDTTSGWYRRRLIADASVLLYKAESDLDLVAYEPVWVRPSRIWIERSEQVISSAQGSILYLMTEVGLPLGAHALESLISEGSQSFQSALAELDELKKHA